MKIAILDILSIVLKKFLYIWSTVTILNGKLESFTQSATMCAVWIYEGNFSCLLQRSLFFSNETTKFYVRLLLNCYLILIYFSILFYWNCFLITNSSWSFDWLSTKADKSCLIQLDYYGGLTLVWENKLGFLPIHSST